MSANSNLILKTLKFLSWLYFVLLCFAAGNLIIMFITNLIAEKGGSGNYSGLGLTNYLLRNGFTIIQILVTAYLCFVVLNIFKKLDLVEPFSEEIGLSIFKVSYLSFALFIVYLSAHIHEKVLVASGFESGMIFRYLDSAKSSLFMAGILYLIAHIFKKGIELKQDKDLTI